MTLKFVGNLVKGNIKYSKCLSSCCVIFLVHMLEKMGNALK